MRKTVIVILLLAAVLTASAVGQNGTRFVQADHMLNGREFHYLDRGVIINLKAVIPDTDSLRRGDLRQSLLRIESAENERFNLIYQRSSQGDGHLLWISNAELEQIAVGGGGDTLNVTLKMVFPDDSLLLSAGDVSVRIPAHGLSAGTAYCF